MRAVDRQRALCLYIEGRSLRAIAEELKVPQSTIERWSIADGFVEKRRGAWCDRTRATIAAASAVPLNLDSAPGERLLDLLREGLAGWEAYLAGELPRSALRLKAREIRELAAAAAELMAISKRSAGEPDHRGGAHDNQRT